MPKKKEIKINKRKEPRLPKKETSHSKEQTKLLPKRKAFQKVLSIKKPTATSTEQDKLNWDAIRAIKHSQENVVFFTKEKTINTAMLKERNVQYLFDAINQIASAKKIVITKIPTPFGDCEFKKLKGDNYLAKINNVARGATTYENLRLVINDYKEYYDEIKKYVELKVDTSFIIEEDSKSSTEEQLYKNIKDRVKKIKFADGDKYFDKSKFSGQKFKITYNQAATLLCGIFAVSETQRTGCTGKMVRSTNRAGFSKSIDDKFPLAENKGSAKMMNLLAGTYDDPKIKTSLKKNIENMSPDSTLLEQESPEKKSPKKPKYSMKDINPSLLKHLKETEEKPTNKSKKKQKKKKIEKKKIEKKEMKEERDTSTNSGKIRFYPGSMMMIRGSESDEE